MPKYIYGGADKHIGRFGLVKTGDELNLTDDEADAISADTTNWVKKPDDSKSKIADNGAGVSTKSGDYTVTTSDKLIKADTSLAVGAFSLTLPATPTFGQIVEVVDIGASASTKNVTIARNGKTIDGAASDVVIDTNGGSKRLYYNGSGWKSF